MIVYSVTINIEESIHKDWLLWMKTKHIPDVMATNLFDSHRFLRILSKSNDEEGFTYNIQYVCPDMNSFELYQEKHAMTMQKEHTDRYKDKFVAFRTLLEEA